MTQEAIKQRYDRRKEQVWKYLKENYDIVEKADYPFDFRTLDQNGIKYIRVEIDALDGTVEEAIRVFKKKCPHNTIFEVKIFEKYQQKPESFSL